MNKQDGVTALDLELAGLSLGEQFELEDLWFRELVFQIDSFQKFTPCPRGFSAHEATKEEVALEIANTKVKFSLWPAWAEGNARDVNHKTVGELLDFFAWVPQKTWAKALPKRDSASVKTVVELATRKAKARIKNERV